MGTSQYDVIVFGATSFVGRLLCHYLWQTRDPGDCRWAIAGRSQSRLQQLRAELGENAGELPIVVADADDAPSLERLCEQARVVVSTVGPYALYGEPLVKACAETGTDYCDLTGEVQWMKQMIERYEETARESGARIIHACGFDSIPSDLGVYFCQQHAQEKFGQYCNTIKMRVKTMRGGISGGTVASMVTGIKAALADPAIRRQLRDPYVLCPSNHGFQTEQHTPNMEYDEDLQSWVGPFIMADVNSRVVFRSNLLQEISYAQGFHYDEGMLTGDGPAGKRRARRLNWGYKLFGLAIVLPPTRWLLTRFFLPKPGEGPSPEQQENGCFELHFVGHSPDGLMIHTQVTGDRDPGYGSTSKMLGEAALCLAFDTNRDTLPGGFWTPASALQSRLIERLEKSAGLTFEVIGD